MSEEVEPIEETVRDVTGRGNEPQLSRIEEIKADLKGVQERAEGEAKEALGDARRAIGEYRGKAANSE